ncbi:Mediator of RNA polymerase II transcription subunit 6 [Lithohypha guttulata]|uniref:Mediator of RNA polymerase II transcription subunit 6 n=1 Tax=Lithohypha guttulata TaxID=1690604 RepID=A0AAN7T8U9_9EURO|nr:Mediator of RNA polymerase II transcription subunit 6 [Lithohypha guttulata]KAK5096876.1 Mediator of RNA polymerase II transcription subunit 6 [Lithohypha guttulata]
MAAKDEDGLPLYFFDHDWIVNYSGTLGHLHSHNVLFYFLQSPFCAPISGNQAIAAQYSGDPALEQKYLATKQKFEAELQKHTGIQYVVEIDALENPSHFKGPNGEEFSHFWSIRAQDRYGTGKNDYKVLGYYYILNEVIFPAPRLESIFDHRMLNSLLTMNKLLKTAAELPTFSASYGYTYFPSGQKTTTTAPNDVRQSAAGTPMPDRDGTTSLRDLDLADHSAKQTSNERTLVNALNLTRQFAGQFYDDAPLIGEPGSFRHGRTKDPVASLKVADNKSRAPSVANSPVPPAQSVKPSSIPASPDTRALTNDGEEAVKPKPKRKRSTIPNDFV